MRDHQKHAASDMAPAAGHQVMWGDDAIICHQHQQPTPREDAAGLVVISGLAVQAAEAAAAAAAAAPREGPAKVEPDSLHRLERHSMPATTSSNTPSHGADDADVTAADEGAVVTPFGEEGGGGAAVPVSPPSSPAHVVTQPDALETPGALTTPRVVVPVTTVAEEKELEASSKASLEIQQFPSGSGGLASQAGVVKIPSTASLPSILSVNSKKPVPIRLGRGRKLCPNCNALTKSAVKQCRECHHFFSPASSRLRPPPAEPKENEELPIPPRRKLRPSQRLIEYELYEAASSSAGAAVKESNDGRPVARRPLGASNTSGGTNHDVVSSGGGGRPAPADGLGAAKKMAAVSSGRSSGGGPKSVVDGGGMPPQQQQQQLQPPKRSHKRKIPLPPGVAPPKRKKGAAAAARAQSQQATTTTLQQHHQQQHASAPQENNYTATSVNRTLPLLSLHERQRVAQDLLASPATALIPTSPELAPMAPPAGPLLFMPPSTSSPEDDDSGWVPPCQPAAVAGRNATSPLPYTASLAFLLAPPRTQHQQEQQQQSRSPTNVPDFNMFATAAGVSVADLLLERESLLVPPVLLSASSRRQEEGDVFDPSTRGQDRDPFEGVELWLEGGGSSGANGGGSGVAALSAGITGAASLPSIFPFIVGDGGMLEHRTFSLEEGMELLVDTDISDPMWSPARAPFLSEATSSTISVGSASSSQGAWSHGGVGGDDNTSNPGSNSNSNGYGSGSGNGNGSVTFPNFERGAALASAGVICPAVGGRHVGTGTANGAGNEIEGTANLQGFFLGEGGGGGGGGDSSRQESLVASRW